YRAPGKLLARVTMPPLDQAESIAYTRDGTALLTGSEGVSSPVYRVPLPPEARARPAPSVPARTARPTASRMVTASSNPAGGTTDDAGVLVPLSLLWIGVAVGAIGVIILIAYRTGR